MRIHSVLALLGVAFLAAAAPRADAQVCAGFTDVPLASIFCNDVSWLKSRQVTLGCTSATQYCPNDPVSRPSMAAFMNRVGNVLTPRVFSLEDSGGTLDLLGNHVLCVTPDLPPRAFGRRVLADAALSYDVSNAVNLEIGVAKSINGGNWSLVQPARPAASSTERNHQHVIAPAFALVEIPNDLVRYAVTVQRTAPILSATIVAWTCHLQVVVLNDVE